MNSFKEPLYHNPDGPKLNLTFNWVGGEGTIECQPPLEINQDTIKYLFPFPSVKVRQSNDGLVEIIICSGVKDEESWRQIGDGFIDEFKIRGYNTNHQELPKPEVFPLIEK
jgi:hypothetical protein